MQGQEGRDNGQSSQTNQIYLSPSRFSLRFLDWPVTHVNSCRIHVARLVYRVSTVLVFTPSLPRRLSLSDTPNLS